MNPILFSSFFSYTSERNLRVKADHREPTREALTKQRPASYKQRRKKRNSGANLGISGGCLLQITVGNSKTYEENNNLSDTCVVNAAINTKEIEGFS
jgi:hypothetical protein